MRGNPEHTKRPGSCCSGRAHVGRGGLSVALEVVEELEKGDAA